MDLSISDKEDIFAILKNDGVIEQVFCCSFKRWFYMWN